MSLYLGNTQIPEIRVISSSSNGVDLPQLDNPATETEILTGYEAIDQNGNKLTGTLIKGVELPTLSNPVSTDDVIEGAEYIDANGTKQTGTLTTLSNLYIYDSDSEIWGDSGGNQVQFTYNNVKGILNPTTTITTPLFGLGDATADDVRAGKTFISDQVEGVTTGTWTPTSTFNGGTSTVNSSGAVSVTITDSDELCLLIADGAWQRITMIIDHKYASSLTSLDGSGYGVCYGEYSTEEAGSFSILTTDSVFTITQNTNAFTFEYLIDPLLTYYVSGSTIDYDIIVTI